MYKKYKTCRRRSSRGLGEEFHLSSIHSSWRRPDLGLDWVWLGLVKYVCAPPSNPPIPSPLPSTPHTERALPLGAKQWLAKRGISWRWEMPNEMVNTGYFPPPSLFPYPSLFPPFLPIIVLPSGVVRGCGCKWKKDAVMGWSESGMGG